MTATTAPTVETAPSPLLRSALRGGAMVAGLAGVVIGAGIVMQLKKVGSGIPPILVLGLVAGLLNAMFAVGLVLVYRASRVINFAHGGFWVLSSAIFYNLAVSLNVSYWLALPAAVVAGGAAGVLSELVFVRRFFRSARLVVAVVSIGLAQLLGGVASGLRGWVGHGDDPIIGYVSPLRRFAHQSGPVRFTGDHLAIAVVAVIAFGALAAFLRLTRMGVAIRGAAQNSDRASELGINVKTLSTVVWGMAGVFAGLAAALQIPVFGYNEATLASPVAAIGLVSLAACVIAGMDNLPLTVVAAMAGTVVVQAAFFAFRDTALVSVVLLAVIILAFLVQRRRLGRTDESSHSTWVATDEVRPIPPQLARLAVVRRSVRNLAIALAVVVLGFPLVFSPSQTNLASLIWLDGMVVISLVVLTGWGGQISLGQYALVGAGAYVGGMAIGKWGWPFPLALLAGASAGAVVAMLLGLTALRIRGLYLAVTTLGFAVVVNGVLFDQSHLGKYAPSSISRPALLFVKSDSNTVYYYLCLAALVVTWWAAVGLRRSRTGRVLIAMRDNDRAAQSYGLNLVRTRLVTFAVSGFIAAAAGVFFAAHEQALDAQSFGVNASIQIFLTAVIGGLGSIQGALLGAVYFAVVNFTIHGELGRLFASSFGVLLVLYAFPGGLGALVYAGRDALLRRIAIRRRIWVPSLLSDAAAAAGLLNRAPLAPKEAAPGSKVEIPARYRQKSRIRVAGASQSGPRWRY